VGRVEGVVEVEGLAEKAVEAKGFVRGAVEVWRRECEVAIGAFPG
jgi:hypothetical protein